MNDIEAELRALLDRVAPPIDLRHITQCARRRRFQWAGWQLAVIAAAAAALVLGPAVFLEWVTRPDPESLPPSSGVVIPRTTEPTTSRPPETTVTTSHAGGPTTAAGSPGATDEEVACSEDAQIRFSRTLLEAPVLSREQLVSTPLGQVLDEFFANGVGVAESSAYDGADGFAVASESLVIGYREGAPAFEFRLDGDRVVGWGDCHPLLVRGELVAYRWRLESPVGAGTTVLPIAISGGGCVTEAGVQAVTEIADVTINETPLTVEVVVWVRRRPSAGYCSDVALTLTVQAPLATALGNRTLLDGGVIPGQVVTP